MQYTKQNIQQISEQSTTQVASYKRECSTVSLTSSFDVMVGTVVQPGDIRRIHVFTSQAYVFT